MGIAKENKPSLRETRPDLQAETTEKGARRDNLTGRHVFFGQRCFWLGHHSFDRGFDGRQALG